MRDCEYIKVWKYFWFRASFWRYAPAIGWYIGASTWSWATASLSFSLDLGWVHVRFGWHK